MQIQPTDYWKNRATVTEWRNCQRERKSIAWTISTGKEEKSMGKLRTINQSIKINHRYTDSLTSRAVEENTQKDENSPSKGRKKGEKERDWKEGRRRKEREYVDGKV